MKSRRLSRAEYVRGVLAGDRSVLARAITLVESTLTEDRSLAMDVLDDCYSHSGSSHRIGVTGAPGAGKSSLIEVMGARLVHETGSSVAVLAVDPSSPVSGGSILGDKTRMSQLAASPNAFVRPSPSAGKLGGTAGGTREAILLCEAAGFNNVLVETVGVGQSEAAVGDLVDSVLLVAAPGGGDSLQTLKRGLLEVAHVVAVNKADEANLAEADHLRHDLETALSMLYAPSAWKPPVLTCSALHGAAIEELCQAILRHRSYLLKDNQLEKLRQSQTAKWFRDLVQGGVLARFYSDPKIHRALPAVEASVGSGQITAFRAAEQLLQKFR